MAATDDEKQMLRSARLAREATEDEVQAFLAASSPVMSEKAITAFTGMSSEQQYRVMYEGPLTECSDSTEVLYARIQRFVDMESQLKKLANSDGAMKDKRGKDKQITDLQLAVGKALVSTEFKEVPEHERRFAPPANTASSSPPKKREAEHPAAMVGKTAGVGGVIEALQKKYNMAKGERAKVVAETKELWKLEGDRSVPKTHRGQGWRWALDLGKDSKEKKSEKSKAEQKSEDSKEKKSEKSKAEQKSEAKGRERQQKQKRPSSSVSRSASARRPRPRSARSRSARPRSGRSRSSSPRKESNQGRLRSSSRSPSMPRLKKRRSESRPRARRR